MGRILLTAGLLFTAISAAQTPTIRVDVSLITVDVQVSDASGRPVTNLTREDFRVFEDGREQPITVFESVDSPYSIQLLIDRSSNMQDYWPLFEPALARFLTSLKPQDRVSIGAFDERSKDVKLLLDWRDARNGDSLEISVDPAVGGIHVPLFGPQGVPTKNFSRAIQWTAERLRSVHGRKSAIVFGDGWSFDFGRAVSFDGVAFPQLKDGEDDAEFKKTKRTVTDSRARFDFVAVNTDLNLDSQANVVVWSKRGVWSNVDKLIYGISVRARLQQLAAISGGRIVFPRRTEEIVTLYGNIAKELGTSYTLGYSPSHPPSERMPRRLEVRSRPGLRIEQSREVIQ